MRSDTPTDDGILLLSEADLRVALRHCDAIAAVEAAFADLSAGRAILPGVIGLEIPDRQGEFHIKGAYLNGSPYVVFKSANSYYGNPAKGLPSSSGFMFLFDAETGFLRALMFDNSLLTHARTGAAGAVAAKYLAPRKLRQVAILGCGTQARHQLECLRRVRDVPALKLWDVQRPSAEAFAREVALSGGIAVSVAETAEQAVRGSDCVVTVTPSASPYLKAAWVGPGMHITAVGSDSPNKQELEAGVLAKADVLIVDRLAQCKMLGETHHALAAGVIAEGDVDGELGDVVRGKISGRTSDDQLTVCDLTGVGVQDAAIASAVAKAAIERNLGTRISAELTGRGGVPARK